MGDENKTTSTPTTPVAAASASFTPVTSQVAALPLPGTKIEVSTDPKQQRLAALFSTDKKSAEVKSNSGQDTSGNFEGIEITDSTEPVKVEDKKTDDKKVEVKKDPTPFLVPPTKADVDTFHKTRDYTKYDPSLKPILDNLRAGRFEEYAPRLQEMFEKARDYDKIKAEKPGYLLDHPEAFTLDPEYRQLESTKQAAGNLVNFYTKQLENIRSKKPWQSLDGFDEKTGAPIYTTHQPSAEADVSVANFIQQNIALQQQQTKELEGYKGKFDLDKKALEEHTNSITKKLFPDWDDTKLSKEEKADYDIAKTLVHPRDKGTRLAGILEKAYVKHLAVVRWAAGIAKKYEDLLAQHQGIQTGGGLIPNGEGGGGNNGAADIVDLKDYDK